MTKFVVVTGGSISGVGKGICTASIGLILKSYGYSVTGIKVDPYINVDAGTMRPTEHGECWVTYDGGETDQDLGTYERFLDIDVPFKNSITTGQVYKEVIDKERSGKFLGKTVQFIPHIPQEIKNRVKRAAKGYDVALVEIGGTVGDYENIPFLFAMKSLEKELGEKNVMFVLVSYMPIPSHLGEMKTKPTQQAIKMLSETGIFPDVVLCRGVKPLDIVRRRKIEDYANIPPGHVISAADTDSVYAVPLELQQNKLGPVVLKELGLKPKKSANLSRWRKLVRGIRTPRKKINVAVVGKYVKIGDYSLADSYLSVAEALTHAGASLNVGVSIDWISAADLSTTKKAQLLRNYDGIIVPGGFGESGVEGKIRAVNFARVHRKPYLGLCYGMQLAVIEFARNVCNWKDAHTTEIRKNTKHPVVDILPAQKKLMEEQQFGGTMRLGEYAATLLKDSKIHTLYKSTGRLREDAKRLHFIRKDKQKSFRAGVLPTSRNVVLEKHRHRYEINPQFITQLEEKGLVFSGSHLRADNTKLMEFIELKKHPFFVGTQGHPELKSSLTQPAPLFYGFVKACVR